MALCYGVDEEPVNKKVGDQRRAGTDACTRMGRASWGGATSVDAASAGTERGQAPGPGAAVKIEPLYDDNGKIHSDDRLAGAWRLGISPAEAAVLTLRERHAPKPKQGATEGEAWLRQ